MTKETTDVSSKKPTGKKTSFGSAASDTIIGLEPVVLNNPGQGNCAFYAFAIGLIYIIQEEMLSGKREMFDRWVAQDPDLRDYYDALCHMDTKHLDVDVLGIVQMSLRNIIYQSKLDELRGACATSRDDNLYQDLVNTSSYVDFAALYFGDPNDTDPRFNVYANSNAIQDIFRTLDRSELAPGYERLALAPLYMSLLYGDSVDVSSITIETPFLANSLILRAMRVIKENYFWGTHLDLDYLARAFEVNLHPIHGAAPYPFVDNPQRPTVTIINQGNYHWVTQITVANEIAPLAPKPTPTEKKVLAEETVHAEKKALTERTISTEKKASAVVPPSTTKKAASVTRQPVEEIGLESRVDKELADRLSRLRFKVSNTVIAYREYNRSVWYSLFHRHGKTGRKRADDFYYKYFSKINDYEEAKGALLEFLEHKNGNTNPHSFRTMLLHELLPTSQKKSLNDTSKHFEAKLNLLKESWGQEEIPRFVI